MPDTNEFVNGTLITGLSLTNGIIGGNYTFGTVVNQATDWATVTGGTIAALATYDTSNPNSWAATTTLNESYTATQTVTTSGSVNSLAFRTAAAVTLTLNNGLYTVSTGGILISSLVGPPHADHRHHRHLDGTGQWSDCSIDNWNTGSTTTLTIPIVANGSMGSHFFRNRHDHSDDRHRQYVHRRHHPQRRHAQFRQRRLTGAVPTALSPITSRSTAAASRRPSP